MADKIKCAAPNITDAELEAAARVLAGGQLFQGPEVEQFELEFARWLGCGYAVAVNSGTTALHLALWAHGVGEGDEVVVPALTFFATVEAVLLTGATPVFCDVDPVTHTMSPDDLPLRLTTRTKAVVPVHLYGGAADLVGLNAVIAEARCFQQVESPLVLEDCAQALGAKMPAGDLVGSGHHAGAGSWSFMATKHITTIEGGMVTTDSAALADEVQLIRNHGMRSRHTHNILGGNYRLNEVGAAIGRVQLERFEELLTARRGVGVRMLTELDDVPWLTPAIVPGDEYRHAYFWLPFVVDEGALELSTAEVLKRLEKAGVECRYRYLEPLYKQAPVRHLVPGHFKLRNAARIAGKVIGLPIRPEMTEAEIDKVVGAVHTIKKRRGILPAGLTRN